MSIDFWLGVGIASVLWIIAFSLALRWIRGTPTKDVRNNRQAITFPPPSGPPPTPRNTTRTQWGDD